MVPEAVPIVICYSYGDDISSCEGKEKTTAAFYSRHADFSLHVGLCSSVWHGHFMCKYWMFMTTSI